MNNQRSYPLFLNEISSETQIDWLAKQSEDIRKVTSITNNDILVQTPFIQNDAYVDPTALLIGGMIISKGCYIGPYAVIRLDEKPSAQPLIIGEDTNLQDGSIVHSTTQNIGSRVIVAHQAIVHGATIEDNVTIYIQAVVDGAGTVIGDGCFIHQGAYVGKGINVPKARYVAPGQRILTQQEADALPPIPDALKAIRAHVMELNALHAKRHAKMF